MLWHSRAVCLCSPLSARPCLACSLLLLTPGTFPAFQLSRSGGGAWPLVLLEACNEEASSVLLQRQSLHSLSILRVLTSNQLVQRNCSRCSPRVKVCLCTKALPWALCPRLSWLHCGKGAADPLRVLPPFPWQWAPQHHSALS